MKFSILFGCLAFLCSTEVDGKRIKADLKPLLHFDQLQLGVICEEQEWLEQFEKVRSDWTNCMGFRWIYLPNEPIPEAMQDLLKRFLITGDETMNVYCRCVMNPIL